MPILASLRGNIRDVSAFIFPLAFVGAVIFDRWTGNWRSPKRLWAVFLLLDGVALAAMSTYYWVPTKYAVVAVYQLNQADYRPMLATYDAIRYEGETFPVKTVVTDAPPWTVFEENATSTIDPYNTYFKALTDKQIDLHKGRVTDVTDGRFNIIDPTGYLFPEVNGTKMYERISVDESEQFQDFINRRQPKWKIPLLQEILDWVSLSIFAGEILFLLAYFLRSRIKFPLRANPKRTFNAT